ncbi:ABC transporter ATP-binding protein (plasmid) [Mesorhizobium sp. ORM8.1]
MANDIILEAKGLTKRFGGFTAVQGLDLQIKRGSIHALIGPNGAGKTTCFNLLTRFLPTTSGSIHFNGADITVFSPAHVAKMGMVRSFQISAVFPDFTCLENVRLALQARRGKNFDFWRSQKVLDTYNSRAEELLAEVGLSEHAHEPAGQLSYGRRRALEIATTLALDPEMLLLDEPTAGMSHADVGLVVGLIQRIRKNRTILMVEHNLAVVQGLSDWITVMSRGRILAEGDYQTVSFHPEVIGAYLGSDGA